MSYRQLADEFEHLNWHVTIDGIIETDQVVNSRLVSQLVNVNCTLGSVFRDLLNIRDEDLAQLAELSLKFLEAMIDDSFQSFPDESNEESYLKTMEEIVSTFGCVNDLIEMATEENHNSPYLEVIREILNKFHSHESIHAAIALSGSALAFRLFKSGSVDAATEAIFLVTELAYSLYGGLLGNQQALSQQARQKANRKHAADPKQAIKLEIYEIWLTKHIELIKHGEKRKFAKLMSSTYQSKIKQRTIEDWLADWELGIRQPSLLKQ